MKIRDNYGKLPRRQFQCSGLKALMLPADNKNPERNETLGYINNAACIVIVKILMLLVVFSNSCDQVNPSLM